MGNSISLKKLYLEPLDKATTCRITADSFAMNPEQAREIDEKVFAKTKGNPFFIHNLLKTLYDKKVITTDRNAEWVWNSKEIDELSHCQ